MAEPIRVVIKGLGVVGKQFVSEFLERDGEVVGAVDGWDKIIGADLGTHCGRAELGIQIEKDLDAVLDRTHPDVLVLANASAISDQEADIRAAITHGVNVVTSAENAFYWRRIEPELGGQLDAEARKAGVTILGTGIQDVFWALLPAVLSGASHSVERISGSTVGIMDGWGPVVMEESRIGWTMEQFEAAKSPQTEHLDPGAIALYALADRLGLTVTGEDTRVDPVTHDQPLFAKALDREIPVGELIGNAGYPGAENARERHPLFHIHSPAFYF